MSNPDSDAEGAEGAIALPNPLDDNLRCTICLEVNLEATTACNSGHTFCGPCLRQMSARGDEACPTCRAVRINLPNRPVRDMVDNLRVRCNVGAEDDGDSRKRSRTDGGDADADNSKAKSGGCDWEGSLGLWMDGHKKVCPYVTIKCPLGCTEEMRRMHLEHHTKEVCSAREVTCDKCQMKLSHCLLQFHTERMCPKGVEQCQYCGESMAREALGLDCTVLSRESIPGVADSMERWSSNRTSGHYSKCPKYILSCEFSRQGCKAKFAREDAAAHHAETARYHAKLVNKKLGQIQGRLNQTQERLDWDHVDFHWALHAQWLAGNSPLVLESDVVPNMSQYELFLKLHLRGPNEPITIAVCSASIKCTPLNDVVRIKNMHLKVTNNQVNPTLMYAKFDMEEEKRISPARPNSGAFHWWISPKKRDGSVFTRADLSNTLDRGVCTIRLDFRICKHSAALLQVKRRGQL